MRKHKVIVSVTNDIANDQRVHKVCSLLCAQNFEVLIVGRKLPDSIDIVGKPYQTKRFNLLFNKGVLFYTEFQLRLFFFLLFNKFDSLHANDLDTLLPNYLVSKFKSKQLVYDSHEYYTEVPELQDNPTKKKIWETVERYIFPKLKFVFTVNQSIADAYQQKYEVEVHILRNVPLKSTLQTIEKFEFPDYLKSKPYAILQGAGINVHRGAEELVESMQFVHSMNLLIVGSGDVIGILKEKVTQQNLAHKVFFISKVPYATLMNYTQQALFGLTLDKDNNLNYKYSLPNKIFDYARAGIPVLASPLIETIRIFNEYEIGCLIDYHDPKHIAEKMELMASDTNKLNVWKENTQHLNADIYWEKEMELMLEIYQREIKN